MLDVDLSPEPSSSKAEGSERGYMGRCRSKTGRKLVRVRAANTQETVWETVVSGRTAESLPVLQAAIQGAEHFLGLAREDEPTLRKRARTEIRLESAWGSEGCITWLLERGYQVTGRVQVHPAGTQAGQGYHPVANDLQSRPGGRSSTSAGNVHTSACPIRRAHSLPRASEWLLSRRRLQQSHGTGHDRSRGAL